MRLLVTPHGMLAVFSLQLYAASLSTPASPAEAHQTAAPVTLPPPCCACRSAWIRLSCPFNCCCAHNSPAPAGGTTINFQPNTVPTPERCVKDTGELYGDRGNGRTFGWSCDLTADSRDRNTAATDRMDTLMIPDLETTCSDTKWEMSLPNGRYRVRAYFCDTQNVATVTGCSIEGEAVALTIDAVCTNLRDALWTVDVDVNDDRLTFAGEHSNSCGLINSLEILYIGAQAPRRLRRLCA